MDSVIIYQFGGRVRVLHPCYPDGLLALFAYAISMSEREWVLLVARKDVPIDVPFWIVPAASIPTDRTFRDAWELDQASMGDPDGVGTGETLIAKFEA